MSETEDGEFEKIGQYPLIKQLGKGGMGSVWYSEHPYLRIPCAIKIMDASKAKENPEFVQRFIQEGRLAAAISHPNVLKVFDANHEGDRFYMVLEFIDGCDMKKLAEDRGGKLPVEEVIEIAYNIGDALRDAYDNHHIIHRDIKPENILVNQAGELKLADLGIGKKIDEESEFNLTMTGCAIGTAYYISPEQAMDSKHIDHRSDMYSLGATLYKLITGDYPFRATTVTAMMMKHANEPVQNPRLRDPELPENFCAVICKLMEKKPEDRYATYTDFLQDIEAIRNQNAPLESLTCSTQGIPKPDDAETPVKKKKMHVSKKAHKHAEELSHSGSLKSAKKEEKKSSKAPLIISIAAAVILIPLVMMFMKSDKKPVNNQDTAKVTETKSETTQNSVSTEKPAVDDQSAFQAFSNSSTDTSPNTVNDSEKKPVIKHENKNDGPIEKLERALNEANDSEIEIHEFQLDGQKITALDLSNNVNLKDLSPLKGLPLSYLNLNNCPNLKSLNGLQDTNLFELSLVSTKPLGINNLEALKGLPLHRLKLYNMPHLNNLDPLANSELQSLYLVNCTNVRSLQPLRENRELEYLEISNNQPSSLRSLHGLDGLPLKTLILENCPQVRSLRPLLDSPLESLTIRKCDFSLKELELLFQVPLKRIDSGNKKFDDIYWAFIENGRKPPKEMAGNLFKNEPGLPPGPPQNNPFPSQNENNGFNQPQAFGNLKVNSLISGELFLDGKKYGDIKAKTPLDIKKLRAGEIKFTLKTAKGSVDGIWEVEANETNDGLIPNSRLAYTSKGLSSTLVSKYMSARIKTPVKALSPYSKQIKSLNEKAFKWLMENRNEWGVWGNQDGEILTTLVTLCLLTERSNLYNEKSHIVDHCIELISEVVRKSSPQKMEEYPLFVMALSEAYALTKSKTIEREVQYGVQQILKSQSQHGAFEPFDPQAERHNLMYSPFAAEALKAAYLAGIYPKEIKKSLGQASKLLALSYQKDKREGPYYMYSPMHMDNGGHGEDPGRRPPPGEGPDRRPPPGEGPGRGPGRGPGGPGEFGGPMEFQPVLHMRAAGCFTMITAGYRSSKLTPALQFLAKKDIDDISFEESRQPMPLMSWYLASTALYNYGGSAWNQWHEKMTRELMKNFQNGYWEPVSREEEDMFHGNEQEEKIFATCLALLILNTQNRYMPYRTLP